MQIKSSSSSVLFFKYLLLLTLAILCILAGMTKADETTAAAGQSAKDEQPQQAQPINYLISFLDDAEDKEMDAVQGWLKEKKAGIVETVNESYVKFIVAKMDATIMDLLEHKNEWKIEAVEEDDFSSYDEL